MQSMMAMLELSEMQLLTGWIIIVGTAYVYLDFRHRFKKEKNKRQPRDKDDRSR